MLGVTARKTQPDSPLFLLCVRAKLGIVASIEDGSSLQMGIFKFLREAGEKSAQQAADKAREEEINKAFKRFGFGTPFKVKVEDDVVHIKGEVPDQETKEKVILTAGNVAGIGEVNEEIETADKAPEATFHTVEKGDTLSKIAKEVYGDAMKYPVIFEANKPMLSDPDLIYPGQVLRCPPLED